MFGTSGDRPDVTNILIIITDGISTVREDDTIKQAGEAKKSGITIRVIGITNTIEEKTLQAISSPPQKINVTYFITKDFEGLQKQLLNLMAAREAACAVTG